MLERKQYKLMKYKAIYWIISKPFVKRYLKKHFDRKSMENYFKKCQGGVQTLIKQS